MPDTREGRLLLAIVLLLFGIEITLVGGGVVGVVIGLIALVVAAVIPRSRP